MLDFFDWIIAFFENLGNFFNNILSTLFEVLELVLSISHIPSMIIGFVPSYIATCAICVGAVGILKLIVGWGNQ